MWHISLFIEAVSVSMLSVSEVQLQPLCSDWVSGVNGDNGYNHFVAAKDAFKTLELVSHPRSFLLRKYIHDSIKSNAKEWTHEEWLLLLPPLACHLFQARPLIILLRKQCFLREQETLQYKTVFILPIIIFISNYLYTLKPITYFFQVSWIKRKFKTGSVMPTEFMESSLLLLVHKSGFGSTIFDIQMRKV